MSFRNVSAPTTVVLAVIRYPETGRAFLASYLPFSKTRQLGGLHSRLTGEVSSSNLIGGIIGGFAGEVGGGGLISMLLTLRGFSSPSGGTIACNIGSVKCCNDVRVYNRTSSGTSVNIINCMLGIDTPFSIPICWYRTGLCKRNRLQAADWG
ncbi:hypothetical protein GYMLUDRAFT_260317 [Collybiopsis luxurians FD-317 M1]|uniref:Uncharacterized protein n=1 Tax=Collybiopsis luxurians FD-317 M1 TaxID=944289 RepID=A0A0D0D0T0_9AGAR|nr:hypothetical protein GYMLUDRAFT_260317 [Collybiopsis luxurians FD-317 M1]